MLSFFEISASYAYKRYAYKRKNMYLSRNEPKDSKVNGKNMLNEHLSPFYQKWTKIYRNRNETKDSKVNENNKLTKHLSPFLTKNDLAIFK